MEECHNEKCDDVSHVTENNLSFMKKVLFFN